MSCGHSVWVYPEPYWDDLSGSYMHPEPYSRGTYEDIGTGAFRCTQCGEVGYYTGSWRRYYEEGIPCSHSQGVPRNLPGVKYAEGAAP